jgi:hypothetical protein
MVSSGVATAVRAGDLSTRGLLTVAIPTLAVDPSGRGLYAGTYGGGVFDYRFPG